MPKVQVNIDRDCEMLEIKVEGKHFFCGNYWDFSVPSDLVDLCKRLSDVEVNRDWEYED